MLLQVFPHHCTGDVLPIVRDGILQIEDQCVRHILASLLKLPLAISGNEQPGPDNHDGFFIVKKLIFQGKKWDSETIYHLKRELGDVMWYVVQCLIALDCTMDEVVGMNVDKLKARYPGGEFDPFYSENRQEGDL